MDRVGIVGLGVLGTVVASRLLKGGMEVAGYDVRAANEVVAIEESNYGARYLVDGIIETPDGRNPRIRTVWIIDSANDEPRLVTAHPLRR